MATILCKKTSYATQQFALDDIQRIKKKSKREKVPLGTYLCKCGSWHLTSKKDFKQEIEELKEKISKLEDEKKKLTEQVALFKSTEEKISPRERIAIKADYRVKELNRILKLRNEEIKKLQKSSSDSVIELIKLHNEVNRLLKIKIPTT